MLKALPKSEGTFSWKLKSTLSSLEILQRSGVMCSRDWQAHPWTSRTSQCLAPIIPRGWSRQVFLVRNLWSRNKYMMCTQSNIFRTIWPTTSRGASVSLTVVRLVKIVNWWKKSVHIGKKLSTDGMNLVERGKSFQVNWL